VHHTEIHDYPSVVENSIPFSLVSASAADFQISKANTQFHIKGSANGALGIKAGNKYKIPGRLLCVGSLSSVNDLWLPELGYA
jgi:hypothetical protein